MIQLIFMLISSAHANEWKPNDFTQFSLVTSVQSNYVFLGSDNTKINNIGLLSGKTYGTSGLAHQFQAYGFEVQSHIPMFNEDSHLNSTITLLPTAIRSNSTAQMQSGFEGIFTFAYSYLSNFLKSENKFGLDFGLRFRRWQLQTGAFPSNTHAGLILATHYNTPNWTLLFEAGLMAIGVGTPTSLGIQRDSSTLRLRYSYQLDELFFNLTPWIEFFHTHRSFYGSTLNAGENSLFVDEALLLLGFGIKI